ALKFKFVKTKYVYMRFFTKLIRTGKRWTKVYRNIHDEIRDGSRQRRRGEVAFKKNCRWGVGNRKKRLHIFPAKSSIWAFYKMPSYSAQFLFIFPLYLIKKNHLLLCASLVCGCWGGLSPDAPPPRGSVPVPKVIQKSSLLVKKCT